MAAPKNLTIYYGTSSTQVMPIPDGTTYSGFVQVIVTGAGFWFTDSTGLLTWIPMNQITKITAA